MTKDEIKAVFDRVQNWPIERQEDAAKMLLMMEEQDASPYHLTEEQADEVRSRIADPDRKFLTLDEAKARLSRLIGERSP